MMQPTRRQFLTRAAGFLAAPAIVRAASIMPVRALVVAEAPLVAHVDVETAGLDRLVLSAWRRDASGVWRHVVATLLPGEDWQQALLREDDA